MSRALTVLTTLVMAGVVAAAGIGLVIAGQRDDPKPESDRRDGEGRRRPDPRPRGRCRREGVCRDIPVEVHRAELDPPRSFRTDADGHVLIPRDDGSDGTFLFARRDRESLAWAQVGRSALEPGRPERRPTRS